MESERFDRGWKGKEGERHGLRGKNLRGDKKGWGVRGE